MSPFVLWSRLSPPCIVFLLASCLFWNVMRRLSKRVPNQPRALHSQLSRLVDPRPARRVTEPLYATVPRLNLTFRQKINSYCIETCLPTRSERGDQVGGTERRLRKHRVEGWGGAATEEDEVSIRWWSSSALRGAYWGGLVTGSMSGTCHPVVRGMMWRSSTSPFLACSRTWPPLIAPGPRPRASVRRLYRALG